MPKGWFVYNPGTVSGGVTATGNYTYIDHTFECVSSGIACTVYAYYKPGTPILGVTHPGLFSTNLVGYLNAAAASTVPLPQGAAKSYVYIKGTRT